MMSVILTAENKSEMKSNTAVEVHNEMLKHFISIDRIVINTWINLKIM